MIAVAVLSAADLAQGFDFVPSQGICALGQIADLRQAGPNRWMIEMTDIRILLQNSELGKTLSSEASVKIPARMTLNLLTGLGGVLVSPQPQWVGRLALFSGIGGDGVFTVPNVPLPLSPNGASFVVFASDEVPTIRWIEQIADILKLTNSAVRLQRLIELVESPAEPLFLRRFSLQQVARIGVAKSEFDIETRTQLLKWRDSQQLIPELRAYADEVLVDYSPRTYQWSEERLMFLRKLRDVPDLSAVVRNTVIRRIDEVQRLKASATPAK